MIPIPGWLFGGKAMLGATIAIGILAFLLWLSRAQLAEAREELAVANAEVEQLAAANVAQQDTITQQTEALAKWKEVAKGWTTVAKVASGEAQEHRRRLLAERGAARDTTPGCPELLATDLNATCPVLAEQLRALE